MGQKDLTQKMLLEYNDVFADICNALMLKDKIIIQSSELSDAPTENPYLLNRSKAKDILRDVAKTYGNASIHFATLAFENQTKVDSKMLYRNMRYDALHYCKLAERKEPMNPVITVVLYFGYKERWTCPVELKKSMPIPKGLEEYVNDYKIHVIEVAWLSDEERTRLKGDFRIIADFLHDLRVTGRIVLPVQKPIHGETVIALLIALVNDTDINIASFYEEERPMDENWRKFKEELINKGREEGMQQGMQQGMQKGMQQGMQQGMQKGMKQGMQKGMQKGREEGELQGNYLTIVKLLKEKIDKAIIARTFSMSVQDIDAIEARFAG